MIKRPKLKFTIISFVLIAILMNLIFKRIPEFVEKNYSLGFDKTIRQALSISTGYIPFSFGEFLVIFLFLLLVILVLIVFIKIKNGGALNAILNLVTYLSALYIIFMVFWGFNYNRLSFDKISNLKIEKSSKQDLYLLCEDLIKRANMLREQVNENSQGVMIIPGGYKDVLKRTKIGYDIAEKKYKELGGKYGPPKPILLSRALNYTGITGIYIPFTGEANVNVAVTDLLLPATAAHEAAHQRGFAREDEANYIAYLTCTMHSDYDFKYSGTMLALIYSMNALYDKDNSAYKELVKTYSEGVKKDLQYDSEFWSKYEGKVQDFSDKVNNSYLKSNGQEDGVQSYGRMVDLLLAEYKEKNKLAK
ncbi:DUF3810 domain-containing protein [Clostridium omnivorum]|uniref:Membrane protein n=1 Tax=Clostridium omnivorum TaxID=1604902 RepID=A0ABQ5N143_9CLOT|nr:DUF3810 domain-containing protein [Clostridium sp. E14]GLC28909.1 membrane protein [Clostridium sp. E14]